MPPPKRARTTLEIAADIATLYMDSRDEFIKNAVRGRGLKDAIAQFEKDGGEPFRGDSAYNKLSALVRERERAAGIEVLIRAGKRDSLPASPADDPPRKRPHRPTPPQPLPAKALTVKEVLQPEARRLAIATYYLGELNAPPPEEWHEHKGTVYDVYSAFSWLTKNNYKTIAMVLEDVNWCAEHGVVYTGQVHRPPTGSKLLMPVGSESANVIARAMERCLGLKKAHVLVSLYRHEKGLDPVSISAVYATHLALKPVVTPIEVCKQGKTDPDSHWALARYMWVTQFVIRLGYDRSRKLPCLRTRNTGPGHVLEEPLMVAGIDFTAAATFSAEECPDGHVFKLGPNGLGYYRDVGSYKELYPVRLPRRGALCPVAVNLTWVSTAVTVTVLAGSWSPDSADELEFGIGPAPVWFCAERLSPIDDHCVVTADEVHLEPIISGGGVKTCGSQKQYRYHWDQNGNAVPEATARTTLGKRIAKMNTKYNEQCRLMLAVALIPEEHPEALRTPGVMRPSFDYSGKWLHGVSDFEAASRDQIKHVQNYGAVSRWVTGRRTGDLYLEDEVGHFKGIQTKAVRRLKQLGITKVRHVAGLSAHAIKYLGSAKQGVPGGGMEMYVSGIGEAGFKNLQVQAAAARPGAHPEEFDHRTRDDPYESLYGVEEGKKQLVADVRTKGYICVTEMVRHLFEDAADFYRKLGQRHPKQLEDGTHDPDYYFKRHMVYHDALALMTDKRCLQYMKEEGYLDRWILPEHGLNDHVYGKNKKGVWTFSTQFAGRVTGDSPELVALDCHCNKDARDCLELHSAITAELATDHPDKFDISTYKKQRDSFLKLLHPENGSCSCMGQPQCFCCAVPAKRIKEDQIKCFNANALAILDACGTVVEGLGNRNGHRRDTATWALVHERRGGVRISHKERVELMKGKCITNFWIHPCARAEWDKLAGV